MTTPTPEPTDVEALLAREAYRALYPGSVNLPDSQRSPETDQIEADRAYQTWDEGRAGCAPIQICQRLAAAQFAALVPWVARQRADALRGALDIVDDYERVLTEFDAKVTAGPEHPVHARGEGAHRAAEIIHQRITEALYRIERPEWFTGGDVAPTTEAGQR